MNWLLYALGLWVLLGFELGAKGVLELGPTGVAPSFVIPLAIYVALGAPPIHALWACLIAGLALDLTGRVGGAEAVIPGPNALGLMLAGQFALAARGMVIRRNPFTLAILSVLGALIAGLVVVAIFTVRSFLVGDPGWDPGQQLLSRAGSALYTGVTGFLLALVLIPSAGAFGFHSDALGRGGAGRGGRGGGRRY